MKIVRFPSQAYLYDPETSKWGYVSINGSIIGLLELAWAAVDKSILSDMKPKDHKVNKRLRRKLREITEFKDKDRDSRITKPGAQILLLEEDELTLLLRHMNEGNMFLSRVSDDVADLVTLIEEAQDYTPPKPIPEDATPTS